MSGPVPSVRTRLRAQETVDIEVQAAVAGYNTTLHAQFTVLSHSPVLSIPKQPAHPQNITPQLSLQCKKCNEKIHVREKLRLPIFLDLPDFHCRRQLYPP